MPTDDHPVPPPPSHNHMRAASGPRRGSGAARGSARGGANATRGGRGAARGARPRREPSRGASAARGSEAAQPRQGRASSNRSPICYQFANTGICHFGARCKFSHQLSDKSTTSPSPATDQPLPQASRDVIDFTTQLSHDLHRPTFTLHLEDPQTKHLWLSSWAAVSVGASIASASALLRVYMRLPASTAFAPHPHHVLRTLSNVVDHSAANATTSKAAVVRTLQLAADIIEYRLLPNQAPLQPDLRTDCTKAADHLRATAHTALLSVITDPRHAERASRLLCRFLELLQRYTRHLETLSTVDTQHEQDSRHPAWAGWRSATVDWLRRAEWLDCPQLQTRYDDLATYATTLRQLVTMLTFYWGAGAVFPKCRHRGETDIPCSEPLCAVFTRERRRPCGRRLASGNVCSAPAKWRCSRKGHDVACDRCLRQLQTAVLGKPGPRASTDVYDAVVERETIRRGGVVHVLSQLASRKPPKIAPNWRTSYRLKCSALVGVVRLGASNEPLESHQRLEFAEIVPVHPADGNMTDFMERQKGRLALRLLTRGDLSSLSSPGEALEHGARVAIIDMQVFVPEVLSVLSTVSNDEFLDHLEDLPFSKDLLGTTESLQSPKEVHGTSSLIMEAIQNTEIELIKRLPQRVLKELSRDLVHLAQGLNLDGTQLRAFAAALEKPLHCTQGPPGTGKSYLGVALVQALNLIRTHIMRVGIAVGPIVVLSYKNHALDEILVDIVKSDIKWHWHTGALIRCGKPEDERLNVFREKNSRAETAAEEILARRVSCMRWVNRILRGWRSLRAAFLASAEDGNAERLEDWRPHRRGKERDGTEVENWMLQAVRACLLIDNMDNEPSDMWAYNTIETLSVVWNRIEETIPIEGPSPFSGLETDTEHWVHEGPSRKVFLLRNWLSGSTPPPRCAANEEEGGCFMASRAPGAYCLELHACWYESGCERRRDEGSQLCVKHRCTYGNQQQRQCERARLRNSNVCGAHTCPRCTLLKAPRVYSVEFGTRACMEHKCKSQACGDVQLFEQFPYCARHGCKLCRRAITENRINRVRSATRFEGSIFCKEHKCVIARCVRARRSENDFPQDFCAVHACIICDGKRNRVSEICQDSRLCDSHRCSQTNESEKPCPKPRERSSLFCAPHTCRVCREEGLPLDRNVIDHPPRNVCLDHALCVFVSPDGVQCNQGTANKSQQYCEHHLFHNFRTRPTDHQDTVRMKCNGITRKGHPCKTQGLVPMGSKFYYCAPHISQMPDLSSSESEDDEDEDENESISDSEQDEEEFYDAMDVAPSVADVPSTLQAVGSLPTSTTNANAEDIRSNPELDHSCQPENIEDIDSENTKDNLDSSILAQTAESLLGTSATRTNRAQSQIEYDVLEAESIPNSEAKHEHASERPADEPHDPLVLSSSDENSAHSDDACDERPMFGANPDELDVQSSDGEFSDDDVPDHMQHLHDIIDNDSVSGSESDEEDMIKVAAPDNGDGCHDIYSHDPKEWKWSQSAAERYRLAAELLRHTCTVWTRLATLADDHVERARRERAEAAGFVFKNARLIGATVVGATRRLHAIRASEPFAMVVEEACEVLEPTLVSVLAVRSLRKLELIGDHRQLPAFIQPCWFSIQTTHPSIKISLFERLVKRNMADTGKEDSSACSVLDVQRRMRPEICDLTRCEYDDLVDIIDDPSTISRRIGDKYVPEVLDLQRELWSSKGREVPGMQSQVFFWNLKSQEGRAAVGISRCNNDEAEACVKLVGWFLHCGIPSESISVITPYKGQKLTILKALRKVRGALPERAKGFARVNTKGVIVSTVDRYQGDENDIVILSLVCTRPGNRFVALRNRFIVALSRARLGLYVIGCTDALTKRADGAAGPSHWGRFLNDLTGLGRDSSGQKNKDELQEVHRIGAKLSICCPRHQEIFLEISDPAEFPHSSPQKMADFCSKPCPFMLLWCGHGCQVPCHSPTVVPHTSKCQQSVQRPCEVHEHVALYCHTVHDEYAASTKSLSEALEGYNCDVMVEWLRPECSHAVQVRCYEDKELQAGTFKLPSCVEKVIDYVNPLCGHVISSPECHRRRKWEENPPACQEVVLHQRPCGCKAQMRCHQRLQEAALDVPRRCFEAVSLPRPRCSHTMSSRCYIATALKELWLEQQGEAVTSSPPLIMHDTEYGPSETQISMKYPARLGGEVPQCRVLSHYRTVCGHIVTVPCSEAFELAAGVRKENPCLEEKIFPSPICGHRIKAACYISSMESISHASLWGPTVDASDQDSIRVMEESDLSNAPRLDQRLQKISKLCNGKFIAKRICGHLTEGLGCHQLFSIIELKKLPPCNAEVSVARSCGHSFDVPCYRKEQEPPVCNAAVNDEFVYPCGKAGHAIRPGTCFKLGKLRALAHPRCPMEVRCIRARCKHPVSVPCYLEQNVTTKSLGVCLDQSSGCAVVEAGVVYCDSATDVAACTDLVTYRRECGHEEGGVQCNLAFKWASAEDGAPPCHFQVEVASPLCEHALRVPCHQESLFDAVDLWQEASCQRITTYSGGQPMTSPVVEENRSEPSHPPVGIAPLLRCGLTTRLVRSCGHEEDVPCESIFDRLRSNCATIESEKCTDCGHVVEVPCSQQEENVTSRLCKNMVEKVCSLCSKNTKRVECYKQNAHCERPVTISLSCGHTVTWICGEEDPITGVDADKCLSCMKDRWASALSDSRGTIPVQSTASKSSEASEADADRLRFASLLKRMRDLAMDRLSSTRIESCSELRCFELEHLKFAFSDILSCNVDLLSQAIACGSNDVTELRPPPNIFDTRESYELVYCILTKRSKPEESFQLTDTTYGFGTKATVLSIEALELDCHSYGRDGLLSICVGGALGHRVLTDTSPFRTLNRNRNKQRQGKKAIRDGVRARRTMEMYKNAGFDHVACLDKKRSFDRVYWIPGAVFPFLKLDVQLFRRCEICMDDMLPSKGWVCPETHFLCRECFNECMERASQPDCGARMVDNCGKLLCPHDGCKAKYDELSLLRQPHDSTEDEIKVLYEGLQKLKMSAHARGEVSAALDVQKRQLEAEFQRIMQIKDLDERQAQVLRLEIVDQILTLRCPVRTCRTAFLDFDGCFALTCARCHIGFCAWCIKEHTTGDIHGHVATCPEATVRGVSHSLDVFQEHQRERRKKLVIKRLRRVDADVRKRALNHLHGELFDLRIRIRESDFA